ncbi:MAG: recombination regulator RecX [Oscillospiraceae bacterium]|jgi:regulatory protein|nr:recombination regulator RecX [Oscillospiraceae bacterium]
MSVLYTVVSAVGEGQGEDEAFTPDGGGKESGGVDIKTRLVIRCEEIGGKAGGESYTYELLTEAAAEYFADITGYTLNEQEYFGLMDTVAARELAFAVKSLATRAMSRKMLIERMLRKGYDETVCEYAADRMEKLRALDDRDYAALFARDRAERGWGERRIRSELLFRGIAREYADEALEELDSPEMKIREFIRLKRRGELDRKEIQRLTGGLMRRGFDYSEIRGVINEIIREDGGELSPDAEDLG